MVLKLVEILEQPKKLLTVKLDDLLNDPFLYFLVHGVPRSYQSSSIIVRASC